MANPRTYHTPRGHQLLYVGEPVSVPIITLENYTKWYEVFMIMPDGEVKPVPIAVISDIHHRYDDCPMYDHCIHPRTLFRIAEALGGEAEERAMEVAAGRWMREARESDEFNLNDPTLYEHN